ncbi:MAG: crotonase/enoyl-CoA hydratase family protein [Actinobacteria bacterium]|nr:crotonase/enoyl-CoA hydratase family protein [Actinomycetota bacterium]
MTGPVTFTIQGDVAVVVLDDGKANALSSPVVSALGDALDRAEAEARALVIAGRDGRFSAGFDLAEMTSGADAVRALVGHGGRLLTRLFGLGIPTVAACTGHALAAGAITLLACDRRVGRPGAYKVGLNEVAIGMALPVFAVEMARARLAPTALTTATLGATIYDPQGAVDAGYLDRLADDPLAEALAEAEQLAGLRRGAYARTKTALRGEVIERILSTLDADLSQLTAPGGD